MSHWHLYMVRCVDGSLYTGISQDVSRRFEAHSRGRGAKFLRGKGPLQLVFTRPVGPRALAMKIEARVKKFPRARKEALIAGTELLGELIWKVSGCPGVGATKSPHSSRSSARTTIAN
ncbi:MAG: GIY-YIG nuclease family protein [Planctomycetota bacterium]|jgi:putative endonuclease